MSAPFRVSTGCGIGARCFVYTVRIVGKCLSKFSLAAFLLAFLLFSFVSFHCVVVQNKSKELQTCFTILLVWWASSLGWVRYSKLGSWVALVQWLSEQQQQQQGQAVTMAIKATTLANFVHKINAKNIEKRKHNSRQMGKNSRNKRKLWWFSIWHRVLQNHFQSSGAKTKHP